MKDEAQFWRDEVRPELMRADRNADLTRIENAVQLGTPDVNGCVRRTDFWLELKALPKHPKPGAIVKIPHLTQYQRLWHRRRGKAGGRTGLLLRIAGTNPFTEYFYFQWPAIYHKVGRVPLDELRSCATVYAPREFPREALVFAIMMTPPV